MNVHKILRGPNARLYLPFGLSRLRRRKQAYFSEKYIIGGYTIEVQKMPQYAAVRIVQSGAAYFEFFTSGKLPSSGTVTQFGVDFSSYLTATIGTDVTTNGTKLKVSPQVLKGSRFLHSSQASAIAQEEQVDLVNEPNACVSAGLISQPKNGAYSRLLYESFAPMHSHTGVYTRHYSLWPNYDGGQESNMNRDVGYDVPWADSIGKNPIRYAYIFGTSDWPRASGIQVVNDPTYGQREFAIWVDAYSQVFAFPTSSITPLVDFAQNVDPSVIRSFSTAFPSWAFHMPQRFSDWYLANSTLGLVEFPEIDWKIHPDGTKMCAVVYKRTPIVYDTAYFTGLPSHSGNPSGDFAAAETAAGFAGDFENGNLPDRYQLATGLLEVTINISLIGFNPEDFTISCVTTTVRDPESTPVGTVFAGYVWHNIIDPYGDGKTLAATRGDMCVADIEFSYDASSVNTQYAPNWFIKNITAGPGGVGSGVGKDILTLGGAAMLDFDMKTLSFAAQYNTISILPTSCPIRTGYPPATSGTHQTLAPTATIDFVVAHPQVGIYTFGKFREMLYPPGIPDAQKDTGNTTPPAVFRANQVGLTAFAMNDTSTWANHQNIRDYISFSYGYGTPSYSLATADTAFLNNVMSNFWELVYVQSPRFGFYLYANYINKLLRKQAKSILFAHPSGSWMYFDSGIIYNKNGIHSQLAHYDTWTPFDASLLSTAVFDRIHLVLDNATVVDTTFIDTYNKSLTNSTGPNAIVDTFQTLSAADFQPTFTKGSYNYTMPTNIPPQEDDGKVITGLELAVQYGAGQIMYLQDGIYQGGANLQDRNVEGIPGFPTTWNEFYLDPSDVVNGGGMFLQHLDANFFTGPGLTGVSIDPLFEHERVVFSTPTMIVS